MVNRYFIAVLLALSLAIPATAGIYVVVEDAPLTDQADLVVRGEILAQRAATGTALPTTSYGVLVRQVIKGALTGSQLELRVPGGRVGDRELVIHGAPSFVAGDRALLFLSEQPDGSYRILHLLQGLFREAEVDGKLTFIRNLAEGEQLVLALDGSVVLTEPARDGDRFVTWIDDRVAGRSRAADYFVERSLNAVDDSDRFTASFTHLSNRLQLRWFEFDEGRSVEWFRHVDGQSDLRSGGRGEFKKALAAWSTQASTRLQLLDVGTTSSTAGLTASDGRNTILFRDWNDAIADDFDCESGGVLAIGGVSSYHPTPREFKGELFHEILEAEIIVNDGTGCLFEESPEIAAEVYTHELGHTLGLGHACGDEQSPKCSSSDLLNSAIMRAFAHGEKGAKLSDDDIVGARYLYDPQFFAAACDLAPGHRKFCKRCGPCGAGQGSCRKSGHCLQGLTCAKNVGLEFGFKPKTNVCVAE